MQAKPLAKKLLLDLPNLEKLHERNTQTPNTGHPCTITDENMKLLGIRMVGAQLLTALEMLYNQHNAHYKPAERSADSSMPETLFHWTIHGMLDRCTKTMVWMELLMLEMTWQELESYKSKVDFEQLFKYCHQMFSLYLLKKPFDDLLKCFDLCEATLAVHQWLSDERESHTQKMLRPLVEIFSATFDPVKKKEQLVHRKTLNLLETYTTPLVERYVSHYCKAKEAVFDYENELSRERKIQEIDQLYERIKRELTVAEMKQLTYHNEIDHLKEQIATWTRKYNDEYENVMSLQFNWKRKVDNFLEYREICNENLEFFRQRLAEHYQQEELAHEADLARMQSIAGQSSRSSLKSSFSKKSSRKGAKTTAQPQGVSFDLAPFKPKTPTVSEKEAQLKSSERREALQKMKEAKGQAEQLKEVLKKSKKYKPSKSSAKSQNKKELEQKGRMINKILKKNSEK